MPVSTRATFFEIARIWSHAGDGAEVYQVGHVRGLAEVLQGAVGATRMNRCPNRAKVRLHVQPAPLAQLDRIRRGTWGAKTMTTT
jgi:hypothetical protein